MWRVCPIYAWKLQVNWDKYEFLFEEENPPKGFFEVKTGLSFADDTWERLKKGELCRLPMDKLVYLSYTKHLFAKEEVSMKL